MQSIETIWMKQASETWSSNLTIQIWKLLSSHSSAGSSLGKENDWERPHYMLWQMVFSSVAIIDSVFETYTWHSKLWWSADCRERRKSKKSSTRVTTNWCTFTLRLSRLLRYVKSIFEHLLLLFWPSSYNLWDLRYSQYFSTHWDIFRCVINMKFYQDVILASVGKNDQCICTLGETLYFMKGCIR